jgi:hypothetical protein
VNTPVGRVVGAVGLVGWLGRGCVGHIGITFLNDTVGRHDGRFRECESSFEVDIVRDIFFAREHGELLGCFNSF